MTDQRGCKDWCVCVCERQVLLSVLHDDDVDEF